MYTLRTSECFFGTFDGWCREQNKSDLVKTTWITNFVRELHDIATHLKEKNISLYESARKSKEAKNKTKNVIGSFFALYLQEWELRLVEKIISWLMSNTDIMKHPNGKTSYHVGVYEFDGIKLLKENVDKYDGGKERLRLELGRVAVERRHRDLRRAADALGCRAAGDAPVLAVNAFKHRSSHRHT